MLGNQKYTMELVNLCQLDLDGVRHPAKSYRLEAEIDDAYPFTSDTTWLTINGERFKVEAIYTLDEKGEPLLRVERVQDGNGEGGKRDGRN
jgi:hypothetical protein